MSDPMDIDESPSKSRPPFLSIPDLNGYSAVYLPTQPPHLLLKPSTSPPRLVPLSLPPSSILTPLSTPSNPHGIAYTTSTSTLNLATLPPHQIYTTPLPLTVIPLHRTIDALSYHPPSKSYAVSTSTREAFSLPKNDPSLRAPPPQSEPLYPLTPTSTISLFSRTTCTLTQSLPLSPSELVLTLAVLPLSLSESNPQEREHVLVVGTTLIRGEDLASLGRLYIYRIIPVVPDPETNPSSSSLSRALKLLYKEEVKGAVTAVSAIGTQGFLMVGTGQKVLVKGFKGEEGKELLPVAFLDTRVQTTVARELAPPGGGTGTGLCVVGDLVGGCWFVGYTVCLLSFIPDFLPSSLFSRLPSAPKQSCCWISWSQYRRKDEKNKAAELTRLCSIVGGPLPTPPLRQIALQVPGRGCGFLALAFREGIIYCGG